MKLPEEAPVAMTALSYGLMQRALFRLQRGRKTGAGGADGAAGGTGGAGGADADGGAGGGGRGFQACTVMEAAAALWMNGDSQHHHRPLIVRCSFHAPPVLHS